MRRQAANSSIRRSGSFALRATSCAFLPGQLSAERQGQHAVLERLAGQLERRVGIVERDVDAPLEPSIRNLDAVNVRFDAAVRLEGKGAQRRDGHARGIDGNGY